MNRQIAIAYGIAGLAVAVAIAAVVATTTGIFSSNEQETASQQTVSEQSAPEQSAPEPTVSEPRAQRPTSATQRRRPDDWRGQAPASTTRRGGEPLPPEIVYVDQPARGGHEEYEDEGEEHEEEEHEHEEYEEEDDD